MDSLLPATACNDWSLPSRDMKESHLRSLLKALSWRTIGTLDTIWISLLFTGKIELAMTIGFIEFFSKIFLFWAHERIWMRTRIGTIKQFSGENKMVSEAHFRSFLKGTTWRLVGSADTFAISFFVNRSSVHALQIAFFISATEVITKIFLYWIHERLWIKANWGRQPV
jgi:uncharacterized membrane protein